MSNTTKNISSCHPSSWHYIQLGPEKHNKIPYQAIFTKNHINRQTQSSTQEMGFHVLFFRINPSIEKTKTLTKFSSGKETSKDLFTRNNLDRPNVYGYIFASC